MKNKKIIAPTILAIIFTFFIYFGFITPRQKFTADLIRVNNIFEFITSLIVSFIAFYIFFNGPIYLKKKKEDKTEEFRKNKKS
ncbi:hypothetical protein SHI21_17545 [Bacteriovorax sp. PP10]|uniref:Uncharacterized protein n=1 Tax=Bacteriovorax antarcticus TaxID=3088717 RepID=A0ABU5VYC1_9BACT|nr:hypothetical protein [Bacteriovorax sp. PP10]MEA9358041.1 hypothetical protein [Bacteriovorax sp. PP10]